MNKKFEKTKILIFFATYNENRNVSILLKKIFNEVPDADLLIVDDNSPDKTKEKILLFQRKYKKFNNIKIISRDKKRGLGTAHLIAMIYSIKNKYDYLVTMDADLSHDPKFLNSLLSKISEGYDFVIGSRYVSGGKCLYDGYRYYLSFIANKVTKYLLRLKVNEFTTSFRVFRVDKLKDINLEELNSNGYTFFLRSIFFLSKAKFKIAEIPITFYDRQNGTSKISKYEIIYGINNLIKLFILNLFPRYIKIKRSNEHKYSSFCLGCKSNFVITKFDSIIKNNSQSNSTNYQCINMTHNQKPKVNTCLQCGLIQIDSNEIPKNILSLYKEVEDVEYINNINTKYKTFQVAYKFVKNFLHRDSTILEIGSYCGVFFKVLKDNNIKNYTGIEPSVWAANYSKKEFGANVINKPFEDVNFSLKKFDLIISWDVFEHVSDPNLFLKKTNTILNKNGKLVLSTIDIDSNFAKITGKHWPWIMKMHFLYFGNDSIYTLFKENNFKVIKESNHIHYASVRYAYKKLIFSLPSRLSSFFDWFTFLLPDIKIPFSLGDVKVYVLEKYKN